MDVGCGYGGMTVSPSRGRGAGGSKSRGHLCCSSRDNVTEWIRLRPLVGPGEPLSRLLLVKVA